MKGIKILQGLGKLEWHGELPRELRESSSLTYYMRLVHGVQVAVLDDRVQVLAKVAARSGADLVVQIEADGVHLENLNTRCSCPVGRNCRHIFAGLRAAVEERYRPRDDLPQRDPDANPYGVRPLEWPSDGQTGTEGGAGFGGGHAAAVEEDSTLPAGVPSPAVRLFCEYPFEGYVGWYSGIPAERKIRMLMVEFTYQEAPGEVFPYGTGRIRHEGWRRDIKAEGEFYREVQGLGLRRCGTVLNTSLKNRLQDALLFFPLNSAAWEDLLMSALPQLAAGGWRVETDPDFDLEILKPDTFYEEVLETGKPDWFAADIGIECDGKRIPLLPLLVSWLKHNPGLMEPERLAGLGESTVLVPMGNGRTKVPVPASRLHRILVSLTELFEGRQKLADGKLTMHRLQAAAFLSGEPDDRMVQRTAESLRSLVAHLRSAGSGESAGEEAPAGLKAGLRPYQLEGFRWLRSLSSHGLGGILADDMGLGKTLQTLAHLLAGVAGGAAAGRPSLIVCPTSVLQNWKQEAAKFTPSLTSHVHYGPSRTPLKKLKPLPDLIITSYPLLVRDIADLEKLEFHQVVLDEAQYIKNPRTQAAACAGKLQSQARICLTGTPMENHLGELWSIMHFLMPGYLGNWDEFTRLFRGPIEKNQDVHRRAQLARRIAPVFLRRTKQAVLSDLPPRIDMIHRVGIEGPQADLYESVRAAMDEHVRNEIVRRGAARSQLVILDALLKLRQVCCHPALLKTKSAKKVTTSAKLTFFLELVKGLVEEGRRILVFSQFVEMLTLISRSLDKLKMRHLMLTGQSKNRQEMVTEFQTGNVPLFLISLKAGGTGLNLMAADTVIHYDPWWNPAVEAQATDRAHRFGQKRTVFVHKLICEGTIEEKILALQERKAALVASLLTGDAGSLKFSEEDLKELLAPIGG